MLGTYEHVRLETIAHTLRRVAGERDPWRLTLLTAAAGAELESVRRRCPAQWPAAISLIRGLPGFDTFQEDPFTSHAYSRPRGYPGDAALLDYIYRHRQVDTFRISDAGRAVFRAMATAAAPTAVRNRQAIVARTVDAAALAAGRPLRVASLGCGHLAEAERMVALDAGGIERFWAIDQDPCSIAEVNRRFGHSAIVGITAAVRDFLRGSPRAVQDLDVFYAAGLFDYLPERAAQLLVRRMFDRLRPGGTLLIANFVPGIADRAYMEAVMDWWLVYRTEEELAGLAKGIPPNRLAAARTFIESENNIAFLALQRV